MPVYDYKCPCCGHLQENVLAKLDEEVHCEACEEVMDRLMCAPHIFTAIVPTYPGSKFAKAGSQHLKDNRPATKLQIGPGGGQSAENPRGGHCGSGSDRIAKTAVDTSGANLFAPKGGK